MRQFVQYPPSVTWTKFRTLIVGQFMGRIYVDQNHDIEQSVLIAGTHRSGTTWLGRLINSQLHYRFVFEPVRHTHEKQLRPYRNGYVRPGEEDGYLRQRFEGLLRGTERNYHLNRKNDRFICEGRLLKDTSVNLLLKWFRQEFPFVPVIYIIRDPMLVVSSCLQVDWLKPKEPNFWLDQEHLMQDYLQPYSRLIAGSKTAIEQYSLEWCIMNFVPLQQFQDGAWQLVRYETLVRHPKRTLLEILAYLQIPFQDSLLTGVSIPSHTAEELVKDRRYTLEKWQGVLSREQQAIVERYVQEFGLSEV